MSSKTSVSYWWKLFYRLVAFFLKSQQIISFTKRFHFHLLAQILHQVWWSVTLFSWWNRFCPYVQWTIGIFPFSPSDISQAVKILPRVKIATVTIHCVSGSHFSRYVTNEDNKEEDELWTTIKTWYQRFPKTRLYLFRTGLNTDIWRKQRLIATWCFHKIPCNLAFVRMFSYKLYN